MGEGLNKQDKSYRHFAQAAKEVGIDRDTRKLAAMDPAFLLEGASDLIRTSIHPDALASFYKTLEGEKETSSRDILDLGNFLYSYRTDKTEKNGQTITSLNDHDIKLIDLGCALIENSFYDGRLLGVSDEHAAVLAFTVNTLAKILQSGNGHSRLKGFDAKKLERFMPEVHAYEQTTLFPGAALREWPDSVCDEALEPLQGEIEEKLSHAESIHPQEETETYFEKISAGLNELAFFLENDRDYKSDGLSADVRALARDLQNNASGVMKGYENKAGWITQDAREDPKGPKDQLHMYLSRSGETYTDALFKVTAASLSTPKRRTLNETYRSFGSTVRVVDQDIGFITRGSKQTKVKSFAAARGIFWWRDFSNVVQSLMRFDKTPIAGKLGEYISAYDAVAELTNKRGQIREKDRLFVNGEKRVQVRMDHASMLIPYLVKTCLIADNMAKSIGGEESLTHMQFPSDQEDAIKQGRDPSYQFIKMNAVSNRSTAYADLHFIPEDIPFAVWANRYLRSKKVSDAEKP